MEKDKDWLSEQVGDLNSTDAVFNESGVSYIDTAVSIERVYDLIYQLDEPEVLSQEWINEHAKAVTYDGIPDQTEVIYVDDLKELLVPKQDLPVIPKFVADYIDDRKEIGFPIYQSIRVVREDSRFEDSHLRKWLWTNKGQEVFARAWLDGYKIEEEPLYYVMKDGVVILSKIDEYHQLDKSRWIGAVTNKEYIKENPDKVRFTEQEIKDYDERFWAFAVPVEEVEE